MKLVNTDGEKNNKSMIKKIRESKIEFLFCFLYRTLHVYWLSSW
jgi:hypothetical protein